MMFAFRSRDVTVCERAPYTYVGYRTKCHLLIIEQNFVSVTVNDATRHCERPGHLFRVGYGELAIIQSNRQTNISGRRSGSDVTLWRLLRISARR